MVHIGAVQWKKLYVKISWKLKMEEPKKEVFQCQTYRWFKKKKKKKNRNQKMFSILLLTFLQKNEFSYLLRSVFN